MVKIYKAKGKHIDWVIDVFSFFYNHEEHILFSRADFELNVYLESDVDEEFRGVVRPYN